jgi:hypothetical protein
MIRFKPKPLDRLQAFRPVFVVRRKPHRIADRTAKLWLIAQVFQSTFDMIMRWVAPVYGPYFAASLTKIRRF